MKGENVITLGDHSYIARTNNAVQELHDPVVEIGKYCSIAGGVKFLGTAQHASATHKKCVANFPFHEEWQMAYPAGEMRGPIMIGNDVWIGENAFIMDGVQIGDGAIVGATATVTKDVPAYAVVVGVPARIVHYRFEPEVIEKLLQIKWWNWDEDKIKQALPDFNDIETFINKHGSSQSIVYGGTINRDRQ